MGLIFTIRVKQKRSATVFLYVSIGYKTVLIDIVFHTIIAHSILSLFFMHIDLVFLRVSVQEKKESRLNLVNLQMPASDQLASPSLPPPSQTAIKCSVLRSGL